MKDRILKSIIEMFDKEVMQNNLRGLWVEAMVAELLGPDWKHTGGDWAAWDIEHKNGARIEVKQSAMMQTWGESRNAPSFNIKAPLGYYPDGVSWVENEPDLRLADYYIFAWHEGADQRDCEQWQFYVVPAEKLPKGQKSIGLGGIRKLADPTTAFELRDALETLLSR